MKDVHKIHGNIGRKQSQEHIKKRVESIAKTKNMWSEEKHAQFRLNVSLNNGSKRPEVRAKNSASHIGQIAWNKGNDWRNKYTPDELKAYRALKMREYRAQCPKMRLDGRMSAMMRNALRNKKNRRHWEILVDYTLKDLMKHLESKFKPGMSWNNMIEWHVDHIIPLSAFNYSEPEHLDFKRSWALNNLQPLWAKDNLKKQDKLKDAFQPSLAF